MINLKFTKIPTDTFEKIVLGAGMILKKFDPQKSETIANEDILAATSGGTSITCVPSYVDFGEDIDNCPKNVMELKRLDSWEVKMSGSLVTVDANAAKLLLGAADVAQDKITPRVDVKAEDFTTLWLVADYSNVDGSCVAIEMKNVLSTGGFSLQTSDKGKGKYEFEFTAHASMSKQEEVPCTIYTKKASSPSPSQLK